MGAGEANRMVLEKFTMCSQDEICGATSPLRSGTRVLAVFSDSEVKHPTPTLQHINMSGLLNVDFAPFFLYQRTLLFGEILGSRLVSLRDNHHRRIHSSHHY